MNKATFRYRSYKPADDMTVREEVYRDVLKLVSAGFRVSDPVDIITAEHREWVFEVLS